MSVEGIMLCTESTWGAWSQQGFRNQKTSERQMVCLPFPDISCGSTGKKTSAFSAQELQALVWHQPVTQEVLDPLI